MAQAYGHAPIQEEIHSLSTSKDEPAPPPTAATAGNPSRHHGHDGQPGSQSPSGVEITTRSDLSLLYRVLRAVIKPLRPRLVRPSGPAQPAGSPRLSPPRKGDVEITETQCEGVWMYGVRAVRGKGKGAVEWVGGMRKEGRSAAAAHRVDDPSGGLVKGAEAGADQHEHAQRPRGVRRIHRVYYFCGGGFQSPPAPEHWRFLAQLAQDLASHRPHPHAPIADENAQHGSSDPGRDAEIELVLVSYPLAPNSPASESLRILRGWLNKVMDEAVERGDTLSLMGDSSGGNVVLSLGFWAAQNYEYTPTQQQQHEGFPRTGPQVADDRTMRSSEIHRMSRFPLSSLISISGPTDLTNSNPDIRQADKLDCVLTAEMTREVAEVWPGNNSSNVKWNQKPSTYESIPLADPSVSPLFNPDAAFHALSDRQVNVHGVLGTHDVLAPDGMEFMRKCQRLGATGTWLVWEGQMHCFPLAGGRGRLGIREGREAREFVVGVIQRDCKREDTGGISKR